MKDKSIDPHTCLEEYRREMEGKSKGLTEEIRNTPPPPPFPSQVKEIVVGAIIIKGKPYQLPSYGTVTITCHGGKVTLVETTVKEKVE